MLVRMHARGAGYQVQLGSVTAIKCEQRHMMPISPLCLVKSEQRPKEKTRPWCQYKTTGTSHVDVDTTLQVQYAVKVKALAVSLLTFYLLSYDWMLPLGEKDSATPTDRANLPACCKCSICAVGQRFSHSCGSVLLEHNDSPQHRPTCMTGRMPTYRLYVWAYLISKGSWVVIKRIAHYQLDAISALREELGRLVTNPTSVDRLS